MASSQSVVDYLAEWDFAVYDPDTQTTDITTYYFSMYDHVLIGEIVYEPRIEDIGNLQAIYLDATTENFSDASITFDNSPPRGSDVRPFSALNEIDDFEDKLLRVYVWNGTDKELIWWGFSKRPDFNNDLDENTCSISGTFPWNAVDIKIPRVPLGRRCVWAFKGSKTETTNLVPSAGCRHWDGVTGNPDACNKNYDDESGPGGCVQHDNVQDFPGFVQIAPVLKDDRNNLVDREKIREACIPLVYGLDDFKIRPENTQARIVDDELIVTALISGTAIGHPFTGDEITADRCRIFDHQPATDIIFLTGEDNQQPHPNLDRFPDNAGHPNLGMISARYDLTTDQIESLEQNGLKFHAMKVKMDNGRPTRLTGLPTNNPQEILRDVLEDKLYGIALNPDYIDEDEFEDAAAYIGERYQFRIELDEQVDLKQFFKEYYYTTAGYTTFENGLIQLGVKRDNETFIATFGGVGGRKIDDFDQVDPEEKDFSELLNSLQFKMRDKNRRPLELLLYDKQAQIKAGNSVEKEISENIYIAGVYEPIQGLIAAAIIMREQLNQDYFIEFTTPLFDGIDVPCGKIIKVVSEDIFNNESNYLFRVIGKDFKLNEEPTIRFRCQVYKPAVYAYNYDPIGGDILRGPTDTSTYTRPPDVLLDNEPTLEIVDKVKETDPESLEIQTVLDVIKAKWNYPDETDYQAENEEDGIRTDGDHRTTAVELWWNYTTESEHNIRRGTRVNYPATEGLIQVDHDPEKTVRVSFVSLARNYGSGRIGYVMDPTLTTALTTEVTATNDLVFDVDDTTGIDIGALVKIRSELLIVTAKTGTSLTFASSMGLRKTEYETHPRTYSVGTEIGLAVWSHPFETIALGGGRYNYPNVTGVVARRRRRGVRVSWNDVNRENVEAYFVLWADDPALLDVAGVPGVWNPDWYEGPKPWEELPEGVQYKRVKELHYVIPYEQIGDGENPSAVNVRVFAKFKRRYSESISSPAVEFHGNGPLYEPREPDFGADYIVSNDPIPGTNRVEIIYRVRFDKDNALRTAGEAEVTHGGIKVQRKDKKTDTWLPSVFKWEAVEDFAQTYVDIRIAAPIGAQIRINRCLTRNDGRVVRKSAVTDVTFRAGAETDDILGIENFIIEWVIGIDGKHSAVRGSWKNGQVEGADTLNVALRRIELWEHEVGIIDPDDPGYWHIEVADKIRDDPEYIGTGTPPGSYQFVWERTAKHKRDTLYEYKLRLYAVGSNNYIETAVVQETSPEDATGADLPITTTPSYPTKDHVIVNDIVGDPDEGTVEVTLYAYADNTGMIDYETSLIRDVTIVLSDFATGEQYRKTVVPDLDNFYVPVTFRLKAAREYRWIKTIYKNNAPTGGRIENETFVRIIAGSHCYDELAPGTINYNGSHCYDANDVSQSTSFSISVGTPVLITNRQSRVPVTLTQRSVRPVLLKKLILETNVPSLDSGTYRRETPENILDEAAYYSAAGVTRVINFTINHPPGVGVAFNSRATAIPYNSSIGSAARNKTDTDSGAGGTDDAVPPPNPATEALAPTFIHGTLGNGGLSVKFKTNAADVDRPYFIGIRIQIADSFSTTLSNVRDWLDVEDGTVAVAATAPSTDANALTTLEPATFLTEKGRLNVGHLRKRKLDVTFKSGSAHGALTMYCRAQVIDLDDTGAIRYGAWSTFASTSNVDFDSETDRDHTRPLKARHTGRNNYLEGLGCYGAANDNRYSPTLVNGDGTALTVNHLGKDNRYGRGASANFVATYSHLYLSGNRWDAGRQGIYWDKSTRSIEMYGNAVSTGGGTSLNSRLYGQIFASTLFWIAFPIRSNGAVTFPNGFTIGIWDRGANNWLYSLATGSIVLASTFKYFIAPMQLGSTITGPLMFSLAPGLWNGASGTPAISTPIYVTELMLSSGPEPKTLFEPGPQESKVEPATGVSLANHGGLAALKTVGGEGVDSITTWGFLDLG